MTPNVFVIGAPKSGTTGLVSTLKIHPDIFVPEEKEPRFFDANVFYDNTDDYPIKNLEKYMSLYDSDASRLARYRVDGSVFNMYSRDAITRILAMTPDAKFILVLRDPVSAVKSMYMQRMKYIEPTMRELSDDFMQCWELSKSRYKGENFPDNCRNRFLFRYDLLYSYERYIPMLSELIRPDYLHIVGYSKLRDEPELFYSDLLKFLDLPATSALQNKRENASYTVSVNGLTRAYNYLARRTLYIRKHLGLHGKKTQRLKQLLLGRHMHTKSIGNEADEDIRATFQETYRYLEQRNIRL